MTAIPTTYRGVLARVVPPVLARGFGEKLSQLKGLIADVAADAAVQGIRCWYLGDAVGPAPDALGFLGREMALPRYPVETAQQYEARLQNGWPTWQKAGVELTLVEQLAAAGFPGAVIYTSFEWSTSPPVGWWSQFWVFFPAGTHTVTAQGPTWGSFDWGDGTVFGPVGITKAQLLTIRRIIRKFKPGHWVCRGLVFQLTGWTYGTGSSWGDSGLVWGGSVAVTGA